MGNLVVQASRLRAQVAKGPSSAAHGSNQSAEREDQLMPHGAGGSASAITSQSMPRTVRNPQQAGPAPPYDDNPHGALHLTGPSATAAGVSMCIHPALPRCNDPHLCLHKPPARHMCMQTGLSQVWKVAVPFWSGSSLFTCPSRHLAKLKLRCGNTITYQGVQSHGTSTNWVAHPLVRANFWHQLLIRPCLALLHEAR